jgi:hypothetical protein
MVHEDAPIALRIARSDERRGVALDREALVRLRIPRWREGVHAACWQERQEQKS